MRGNQTVKKLLVSAIIIGVFIIYSFVHGHSAAALAPTTAADSGSASSATSGSTTSGGDSASASSTPTVSGASGRTSGQYKDGTYTGSVADAQWGYIQVKAIVQGGKLTDVQFLQYPNERERSVEINTYADPQLTTEAIQAQSAQVDVVTGATDSSEAFMQSLADALSQAQA